MGKYSYNSQTEDNLVGNLERNLVLFFYILFILFQNRVSTVLSVKISTLRKLYIWPNLNNLHTRVSILFVFLRNLIPIIDNIIFRLFYS